MGEDSSNAEKEVKKRKEKVKGKEKDKGKEKAKKMRWNLVKLNLIGGKPCSICKGKMHFKSWNYPSVSGTPYPFNVISTLTNLDGLVRLLVDESILYTWQKGKEFHTNEQEIAALLGINYIVFINKLPTIKSYWDCGQSLVTKTLEMFWLDQDLKTSS